MTLRALVIAGFCALVGLVWIIESGAADVFLEAARPDFQKIPLAIAGIENLGGTESPEGRVKLGSRIEEVLKTDVRRSLVFALVDVNGLGIKAGQLGAEPDPSFKHAVENDLNHRPNQGPVAACGAHAREVRRREQIVLPVFRPPEGGNGDETGGAFPAQLRLAANAPEGERPAAA